VQAERISLDTAWSIAAIQYQLDRTMELIDDHVVQRTTVDPGSTYGGLIIMDKLKRGDPPTFVAAAQKGLGLLGGWFVTLIAVELGMKNLGGSNG